MKVKREHIFTIVFMLAVSAICALILASANAFFLPTIRQNEVVADRRALLYVFGMDTSGSNEAILQRSDASIKTLTISGRDVRVRTDTSGKVLGLAVPFEGAGLWGRIQGYLGVSPDRSKILGVVFTLQNETPGLGGRIDELPYREQFRELPLKPGQRLAYGAAGGGELDAISGATQTSNAVLSMLNSTIENTVSRMEVPPNA